MENKRSSSKATTTTTILLLILLSSSTTSQAMKRKIRLNQPCKTLLLYFHDIIYNGRNIANATSAIVGAPVWANRTTLGDFMHFGDVIVFDDPITMDNNLHSETIGRAQGLYLYDKKQVYSSWFGFSFVLNSSDYKGTINFIGADPLMEKTRDVSVVGGTGDFFMSRGVATLTTDAVQGDDYFRLECY
ncbi:disease resistance response protein 206-like [Dioscorea cayenensis subsp. rotundata]|uniref:Dirigent protein n=1 Tax=Dioscorea cayennensis subsp. rotundata TaxID=55577 RepID=A0AB40AKZ0_DIOCR|nr:disease resistance response protein 206-like [Dioscorea cayenensis subsp. rotundata]